MINLFLLLIFIDDMKKENSSLQLGSIQQVPSFNLLILLSHIFISLTFSCIFLFFLSESSSSSSFNISSNVKYFTSQILTYSTSQNYSISLSASSSSSSSSSAIVTPVPIVHATVLEKEHMSPCKMYFSIFF